MSRPALPPPRGLGRGQSRLPRLASARVWWLIASVAVLTPLRTPAQVYCSQWAEVVDAPTNIRRAPNSQAAIACQLPRKGLRLLVYPVQVPAHQPPSRWYATLICRPAGQRAAIGLGQAPDYIHRSQVRLLGINREDWFGETGGKPTGPCAALWPP